MKQKLYLLMAAFLLLSFYSNAQSTSGKQLQPYFGDAGIKKKISELLAVKPVVRKQFDSTKIRLLNPGIENFPIFTESKKGPAVAGKIAPQNVAEENSRNTLSISSSAASTNTTQKAWSNFLSADFYENPIVGWPPDPCGDVGAAQIIVASNLNIKVFNKPAVFEAPLVTPKGYSSDMAHSTFSITLDQFFSPVLPDGSYTISPQCQQKSLQEAHI